MTVGKVPLACYATTGTKEVAASLEPHLAEHDVILLANHGLVTYGATLSEAFMKTETVEHLAQVALAIHQLGSPCPLRLKQIEDLKLAKASYQRNGNHDIVSTSDTF